MLPAIVQQQMAQDASKHVSRKKRKDILRNSAARKVEEVDKIASRPRVWPQCAHVQERKGGNMRLDARLV